jgi:hypothetical protein
MPCGPFPLASTRHARWLAGGAGPRLLAGESKRQFTLHKNQRNRLYSFPAKLGVIVVTPRLQCRKSSDSSGMLNYAPDGTALWGQE